MAASIKEFVKTFSQKSLKLFAIMSVFYAIVVYGIGLPKSVQQQHPFVSQTLVRLTDLGQRSQPLGDYVSVAYGQALREAKIRTLSAQGFTLYLVNGDWQVKRDSRQQLGSLNEAKVVIDRLLDNALQAKLVPVPSNYAKQNAWPTGSGVASALN